MDILEHILFEAKLHSRSDLYVLSSNNIETTGAVVVLGNYVQLLREYWEILDLVQNFQSINVSQFY